MLKLITTDDGSHSLYREDLKETYHSHWGARGESRYVFIEQGIGFWCSTQNPAVIRILEVGLGTGLNAWLTWQYAQRHQMTVSYAALEPYPVPASIYASLNYAEEPDEKATFLQLHESPWSVWNEIPASFHLYKSPDTLQDFVTTDQFDVIYFDAFAPSKQPDVWEKANIEKCYRLMSDNGILVTYCAQGQFKRNLASAGFDVETLPGALGKKEMVEPVR
ncbi:MAG: tRNA (5-methylaminomethyl-2-thiouridine)(34)-methyltransferase MnmD, partial [Cyclobacteriaceae bacterium]|nr:tRNA (5-methylaminomethyl-2-thiouridine)(34)-methyltransferase MnmD [Cyclobacteriaceae bacterium]